MFVRIARLVTALLLMRIRWQVAEELLLWWLLG